MPRPLILDPKMVSSLISGREDMENIILLFTEPKVREVCMKYY